MVLTLRTFLLRKNGALCEAVLDWGGCAVSLEALDRSNVRLWTLDRRGDWYRYHHLFRDMLLAELHRLDPGLIPVLYRRAAEWHERSGTPGEALEYRMKGGEVDAAARLVGVLTFPPYQHGTVATVERWFGWLEDHGALESHPAVAVLAAVLAAMTGKPADAERWAKVAERGAATASLPDGSPSIEPWLALLRAILCRDG